MGFGSNLIALRESRNVSRKELAELLNIPYTTLRNYETEVREPGHELLKQISAIFAVSVDELVGNHIRTQHKTVNTRKVYNIIGGLNGTGKSSLTGVLKSQLSDLGVIIDVDKITAKLGGNTLQGARIALERIEACLANDISFTQETTLSGRKTSQTAKRARDAGYYVRLFYIGLDSSSESLKRIANRVSKGGHNIPSEDVERRFISRWEDLSKVLPYCHEAHFFDNDNGFVEVAEYKNGELLLKGNYCPLWLRELNAYLNIEIKI